MTDTHKRPDLNAWYMDWEQIYRDTRIRAAAPELLAALEACLAVPNKNRPDYIWDDARAAIAKATGAQS
jgi:hypothetical protein